MTTNAKKTSDDLFTMLHEAVSGTPELVEFAKVLQKDKEYLGTIAYAVTEQAMRDVAAARRTTVDAIETDWLDCQGNPAKGEESYGDAELTARLFIDGVIARKRTIEYANKSKIAAARSVGLDQYQRWEASHPDAALDPIQSLPVRFKCGLISEEFFRDQYAKAQDAVKRMRSEASASI